VLEMVNDSGSRVTLGGWSLGGVVAREFARQHPEAARHAINYGTPVVLGPRFTALARLRSAASVVAARSLSGSTSSRPPR